MWWKTPSRDDMRRAVARLTAKVRPDSVVMLYFGGYGVQAGRDSYMAIPVDAGDLGGVRRPPCDGVGIEAVLDGIRQQGASVQARGHRRQQAQPL